MTNYVVDTSVAVQYLVEESNSEETKNLFRSTQDSNKLFLPEFALLECTNVVWKYVRFHGVTPEEANELVKALLSLDIVIVPATGLMPRALEIGLKHKLAIYDSVYIALAENLNYPLITVDKKQAKASQAEGITLKDIADFTS